MALVIKKVDGEEMETIVSSGHETEADTTGKRLRKAEYYLGIAEAVSKRSTCLRRKYGAVIVNHDEIVSTGYNGAPRGEANCCDTGICVREEMNIPKGERYELCVGVHAEQNAMLSASRKEMEGARIYIVGTEADGSYADPNPCLICARMLKNSGVEQFIGRGTDGNIIAKDV